MNVRPLGDRVVVRRVVQPSHSPGGILIPDSAKRKSIEGCVIAVGSGPRLGPLNVNVGDRVVFGPHAGTEIRVDGEEFVMLEASDLLAVNADPPKVPDGMNAWEVP
jgi:chaperonin GroES